MLFVFILPPILTSRWTQQRMRSCVKGMVAAVYFGLGFADFRRNSFFRICDRRTTEMAKCFTASLNKLIRKDPTCIVIVKISVDLNIARWRYKSWWGAASFRTGFCVYGWMVLSHHWIVHSILRNSDLNYTITYHSNKTMAGVDGSHTLRKQGLPCQGRFPTEGSKNQFTYSYKNTELE